MWRQTIAPLAMAAIVLGLVLPSACGGRVRPGASCRDDADCRPDDVCVTDFSGGYCGKKDCSADGDCPSGTLCTTLMVGTGTPTPSKYCLASCEANDECTEDRLDYLRIDDEDLPTCAEGIGGASAKVCLPPACKGGTCSP